MITKKSKSLQKPWGKIHFLLITKVEKRRVFVVHTTSTKSPYGRSIFTILFLCAWKCAIDWYVRSTLFTFNQGTKGFIISYISETPLADKMKASYLQK